MNVLEGKGGTFEKLVNTCQLNKRKKDRGVKVFLGIKKPCMD